MAIKKKSDLKLTVKGAKLGGKPKPRGYRLGENAARSETKLKPERPKPRVKNIAKKGP